MSSHFEDLYAFLLLCRLMQVAKQGSRNAIRYILVKLPTCLIFPKQHKNTHTTMSSDLEDLCAFALLCRLMQVAEQGSRNAIRYILVKLPTCLIFPEQHKNTHTTMSSDLEDLCAFALLCRLMQVAEQGSRNAIRYILVKLPTCLIFPDQHKNTHTTMSSDLEDLCAFALLCRLMQVA